MSLYGLNPQAEQQQLERASGRAAEPIAPTLTGPPAEPAPLDQHIAEPGFFQGSATALPQGVGSGAVKIAAPFAELPADTFSGALDPNPNFINPDPTKELTPTELETHGREAVVRALNQFKPDPRSSGAAAQVLHGLGDVGSRVVIGSAFGGPVGGAALAGTTEYSAARQELLAQGVDEETASRVAGVQGSVTALGALLPGGVGSSLGARMLSGAGINTAVGAGSRGATHALLADAGYTQQAEQYKWLDREAVATDVILGLGFGGLHHVFAPVDTAGGEKRAWDHLVKTSKIDVGAVMEFADRPPPAIEPEPLALPRPAFSGADFAAGPDGTVVDIRSSTIDAALTSNEQHHAEIGTAPGIPTTPEGRDTHNANLTQAAEQLLRDEPVSGMQPVESIPNAAESAREAVSHEAVRMAADEAVGEHIEVGAVTEAPATSEQIRIRELRAKFRADGDLSHTDALELIRLQQTERTQATVNGHRIEGVLTPSALADLRASGETHSHTTIFDLNNFKDVNDTYGHPVGDQAIRAAGEAASEAAPKGVRVVHRGGDEFNVHANSERTATKVVEAVRERLAGLKLRAVDAAGKVIAERTGVGLAHGTGENEHAAELALKAEKERQRTAGERHNRGEQPGRRTADRAGSAADAGGLAGRASDAGAPSGGRARAEPGRDASLSGDVRTDEAVTAARAVLDVSPDLMVPGPDGAPMRAADAMQAALDDLAEAKNDAELVQAAAACFGRVP